MKISIITAVLNNKDHLETCLMSIASQTYPDIEHIIIDGGSSDGTLEVISHFTSNTSRITRLISEPDNGIYDALNKGIGMATGDIIGFLHADDFYADNGVIAKVAETMEQKNSDSCYGDLEYVRESGLRSGVIGDRNIAPQNTENNSRFTPHDSRFTVVRYWKSGEFSPDLLLKGWMPPHPTFFVRRSVYEKYGVFDTSFRIAADYELMMRFLGRHGISTCYIPEVLIKMRMGGASNRSISNILRKSSEDLRIMRMHDLGGLPTLLRKNLSKIPQFISGR